MTDEGWSLLGTLLTRRELAEALACGPHSKPELVDVCAVSRSTVDRGIAQLVEDGIATRANGGRYELTLFGAVLVSEFERVLERMKTLSSVGDLLGNVPSDMELSADLFEGATISHSTGMGITTVLATFREATELHIVNPQLPLVSLGLLGDPDRFADCAVTVLVRQGLLAELTAITPGIVGTSAAAGIELVGIDVQLPFSFALVDSPGGRRLCLMFGNGLEGLAIVENSSTAAVEWGQALYERLVDDARPDPLGPA